MGSSLRFSIEENLVNLRRVDAGALEFRFDPSGVSTEEKNARANAQRFRNGVCHEQKGELGVRAELQEIVLHFPASQGVQRSERLVHQQDLRLHGHCSSNGNALLHAAG